MPYTPGEFIFIDPFDDQPDRAVRQPSFEGLADLISAAIYSVDVGHKRIPSLPTEKELEQFAKTKDARLVYNSVKELSEYCGTHEIDKIVFLDRTARPMWNLLSTYNKLSETENPQMFFLSPSLLTPQGDARMRPQLPHERDAYKYDEAQRQLELYSPDLIDDPESGIMIFDICAHTGNSVNGVADLLKQSGMKNIHTGSLHDGTDSFDFSITDNPNLFGCRPFTIDDGLERYNWNLYSDVQDTSETIAMRRYSRHFDRMAMSAVYKYQERKNRGFLATIRERIMASAAFRG